MLRDHSGSEPTDPAKVAQVVVKLADRDDAPVRLLLGTDAVLYAPAVAIGALLCGILAFAVSVGLISRLGALSVCGVVAIGR
jgi:hypothetical protein